jgi:hypothetical protein
MARHAEKSRAAAIRRLEFLSRLCIESWSLRAIIGAADEEKLFGIDPRLFTVEALREYV